jgi:hypothetical protein
VVKDREPDDYEILEEIERRALFDLPDDDDAEPLNVVELAGGEGETGPAKDLTLGGYIELHNRVPAFEGADGQPYTVDIEVDESAAAAGRFTAFLVFVRWAATGAGIMDHVESDDIATADSADAARQAVLDLTLYEIRAELDAAIARKRRNLED